MQSSGSCVPRLGREHGLQAAGASHTVSLSQRFQSVPQMCVHVFLLQAGAGLETSLPLVGVR